MKARRKRPAVLLVLVLALAPVVASAEAPTIDHGSIGCIVAGKHPQLGARLQPATEVAQARVYFRAQGTQHWYYVPMEARGDFFTGVLPKPKKDVGRINYYVEAIGRDMATARTAELSPIVVEHEDACSPDVIQAVALAGNLGVTPVAVGGGAPASPAGFGVAGGGVGAGTALFGAALIGGGVAGAMALKEDANGDGAENANPIAGAITVSPALGLTGVTRITFAAPAASDPDGDALAYAWDFGDGTGGSGPNVTHVYDRADRFPVRLQVSDPQGATASSEASVTVRGFAGTWEGMRTQTASFNVLGDAGFAAASTMLSANVSMSLAQRGTSVSGQYSEATDLSEGEGVVSSGVVSAPRNFELMIDWEWCTFMRSGRYCTRYLDTWSGQLTENLNRCAGRIVRHGQQIGSFDLRRVE